MRRTEQAQGLRLMKFEEVYGRSCCGVLGQAAAAEILGVSERTFRRWRDRFEADGAEGLYDRRLGRVSARRAPIDEVARVLELFDTRYWDFTAKHFHEKLVAEHGCGRSHRDRHEHGGEDDGDLAIGHWRSLQVGSCRLNLGCAGRIGYGGVAVRQRPRNPQRPSALCDPRRTKSRWSASGLR